MKILKIGMVCLCISAMEKMNTKKLKGKSDLDKEDNKSFDLKKNAPTNLRPVVKENDDIIRVKKHNYFVPTTTVEDPCLPKIKLAEIPKIELNMKINIKNDECCRRSRRGRQKDDDSTSKGRSNSANNGSKNKPKGRPSKSNGSQNQPRGRPSKSNRSQNKDNSKEHTKPSNSKGSKNKNESKERENDANKPHPLSDEDERNGKDTLKRKELSNSITDKDTKTPNIRVVDKNEILEDPNKENKSKITDESSNQSSGKSSNTKDTKSQTDKNLTGKSGFSIFGVYGNPVVDLV
jgi:hypothetical protein